MDHGHACMAAAPSRRRPTAGRRPAPGILVIIRHVSSTSLAGASSDTVPRWPSNASPSRVSRCHRAPGLGQRHRQRRHARLGGDQGPAFTGTRVLGPGGGNLRWFLHLARPCSLYRHTVDSPDGVRILQRRCRSHSGLVAAALQRMTPRSRQRCRPLLPPADTPAL